MLVQHEVFVFAPYAQPYKNPESGLGSRRNSGQLEKLLDERAFFCILPEKSKIFEFLYQFFTEFNGGNILLSRVYSSDPPAPSASLRSLSASFCNSMRHESTLSAERA